MSNAAIIHAAAARTTARFDGMAWISETAKELGWTVEQLGAELWSLKAAGEVRTRRCDLNSRGDAGTLATESEVPHPFLSTASIHLIILPEVIETAKPTEILCGTDWVTLKSIGCNDDETLQGLIAEGYQVR